MGENGGDHPSISTHASTCKQYVYLANNETTGRHPQRTPLRVNTQVTEEVIPCRTAVFNGAAGTLGGGVQSML